MTEASLFEGRALRVNWPATSTPLPSPQDPQDRAMALFSSTLSATPTIRLPFSEPPTLSHPHNFLDYILPEANAEMSSASSSPSSDISELSTDSSASSMDTTIPQLPGPPTLSFEDAAADAASNIQYAMETFPTDTSYIAEQYKKDGVHVEGGDRVVLLEELPNFAVRVKVVKNGNVGLLPAWNMEDPFERLARLNMEFNEAVTCPAEVEAKNGESGSHKCTLAHVHARCPTQTAQTRRQFVSKMRKLEQESGSSSEDSLPTTPNVEPRAQPFKSTTITARTRKSKSVQFGTQRKVVFRYYMPANLNKKEKRPNRWDSDSDSEDLSPAPAEAEVEDDDAQWWWNGWTEDPDAAADETITAPAAAEPEAAPAPASVAPTHAAVAPIPIRNASPPVSKPETPREEKDDSDSRSGRHNRIRGRIRHYALRVFQ